MNENMRESLSALMDDEANELELERVLTEVVKNAQLRQRWGRQHLARGAVQGQHMAHLDRDISVQVRTALENQQSDGQEASASLSQRVLRPLTSLAVAASVAATVVLGGQQLAQLGAADSYDNSRTVAASASPVGMLNSLGATPVQASFGTQPLPVLLPATRTAYQELARQRMRRYSQEHAAHAALNSPQGLIPFARVPKIRE